MSYPELGPLIRHLVIRRTSFLPLALLLVCLSVGLLEPTFLTGANISNTLRNGMLLAVVAVGQSFVLITGGFDLSNGAVVALSSVVMAIAMSALAVSAPDHTWIVLCGGVAAALLASLGVGLINGLLVGIVRIPGFIGTLGTMSATFGLVFLLTNGIPVYGLPATFVRSFGRGSFLGVSLVVYVAIVLVLVLFVVQRRFRIGRHLYAVGSNEHAARVSGVPVLRTITVAYLVSSLSAGVVGIFLTAQVGSGQATLGGEGMMLQSIAAAVIGGVSLKGGIGRVEMVVVGAVFLSVIGNALNLLRIDSKVQIIIIGLILTLVAGLDARSKSEGRNGSA